MYYGFHHIAILMTTSHKTYNNLNDPQLRVRMDSSASETIKNIDIAKAWVTKTSPIEPGDNLAKEIVNF